MIVITKRREPAVVWILMLSEHCRNTDFPTHMKIMAFWSEKKAQRAYKKLPKSDNDFERVAHIVRCPVTE